MIADLDTFKTSLDIPETDDSQNEILNIYLNAVDGLFNKLCDREFDSTTYTHEEHNGDGGKRLWLKHIPVTQILQISTERIPAIKIKNTTSDAARATIDVDVSAELLYYTIIGGTSATARTSIDLTDAGSDTLAELVSTIDALGSGWDAEMYDTDLNSIPSTELLEVMGLNCGVPRRGGAAVFRELDIPGDPLADGFRIDNAEMGTIYSTRGFWNGINNIIVSYVAGYTAATMPSDLKLGVLAGAAALYARGEEDGFGAEDFNQGTLEVNYADWLPDYTLNMIQSYKRPAST
jgi:hypothetical protein